MPHTRRWRKRARSAPPVAFTKANHPSKRKQWTDEQMLAAMKLAENGEISANHAADIHGVLARHWKTGWRVELFMEQSLDHVLTWILQKKGNLSTTFLMPRRLALEKRGSKLKGLLKMLQRRRASLSQKVSPTDCGKGFRQGNQS